MKDHIHFSFLGFMAVSLVFYALSPRLEPVLLFGLSSTLLGLKLFIDRKRQEELDLIKNEFEALREKVNGLSMARGFK